MSEIQQLDELFDEDALLFYPVINMNPKYKVPQVWQFAVPGTDSLMARLMQFTGKETVKQFKRGDAIAEVFLMSGTSHGHAVPLKGGLGDKPIDAIHLIFRTVWESLRLAKPDVVLFRFPSKKMKGQEQAVKRIMARLIMQNTGGRYRVLPDISGLGKKNAYVIMYRKGADLLSVDGMPPIPEKYVKVETKVGDQFTDKETGNPVTKEEVAADALIQAANVKTDAGVASKTKFSRRALASASSIEFEDPVPEGWEEVDASASEIFKAPPGVPIPDQGALEIILTPTKNNASVRAQKGMSILLNMGVIRNPAGFDKVRDRFHRKLMKAPPNSMAQMEAFAEVTLELLHDMKNEFWPNFYENAPSFMSDEEKRQSADAAWARERTKVLKHVMKDFANDCASGTYDFTTGLAPGEQWTSGQKYIINEYCGPAYSDINSYLVGRWTPEGAQWTDNLSEIKDAIKSMDDAFKNGQRIPPGITLYRGHAVRFNIYKELVKTRMFYFRNYVSTSLMPIIFGGWKANVSTAVVNPDEQQELTIDKTTDIAEPDFQVDTPKVVCGWTIEGAHKINVIYPGQLAGIPDEQEIILPRGTVVKINEIIDASNNGGMRFQNQRLIKSEVMANEELTEGCVVYDGDALFEDGRLVEMNMGEIATDAPSTGFSSFVEDLKPRPLNLLAELIDFDAIPPRMR